MSSASLKAQWNTYLPVGSLRARCAHGAFWMMMGSGVAQFFTAFSGIVIARVLGVEGYGALAIVTSTIAMFNIIAELSLGITTNKHVAEFRKTDPDRAGRIIGLGFILTFVTGAAISLLVAVFAEPLAVQALKAPEIAPFLRLGATLLLFSAMNGVQLGTLAGFECFRIIAVSRVAMALVTVPLIIGGVFWHGIEGVIIGQIIAGCVSFLWFRHALMQQTRAAGVHVSYRNAWDEHDVLLSFALPSMLSGMMFMPILWTANAILVRSSNGLAEMGMFNAANQWRNLIIWVPTAIGEVALPILTSLLSEGNRARFNRALRLNIGANLLVGLVVAAPIALGSYWIMSLYGPGFSRCWLALVMICGAAVLQATINVIGQVIASTSRMWWGFFLNLIWAIEFVTLTWLLVRFGANGLATAYFLAYLLHLVQVAVFTTWVLRHDPRLSKREAWPNDLPSLAAIPTE